jgi:hypothetical protein
MAPRLKFPALLAGLCAAVFFGIAMIEWPGTMLMRVGSDPSPDLTRMQHEVARITTTMRRLTITDTVTRLLSTTDAPVVIAYDSTPSVVATVRSQLREPILKARAILIAARPDIALAPKGYGGFLPRAEFIFNGESSEPWCAAVHYKGPQRDTFGPQFPESRLLGPCLFWARYGAPGADIAKWLDKGGYRFADAPADYVLDDLDEPRARRAIFGLRRGWYIDPFSGDRCLAGHEGACAKAVLDTVPVRWRRGREALPDSPPTFVREDYGNVVFGSLDPAMLAQLERRFGADAFGRFWQSSDAVEPAFLAAFGISLDEWVREWARAYYGAEPVGPRVRLTTVLLSLLSIGILLGIAVGIVQRREVR